MNQSIAPILQNLAFLKRISPLTTVGPALRKCTYIVLVAATFALSGCATFFNPYIAEPSVCTPTAGAPTVAAAVKCADSWTAEYRKALGQHAKLSSITGVSLIIASAAAFGIGATGAAGDNIIWLGAAGAATYGSATWLSSRPREAAYVAGMKAMNCVVTAAQPLVYLDAVKGTLTAQLSLLDTALKDAKPALQVAEAKLAAVKAMDPGAPAAVKRVAQATTEADQIIRGAEATIAAAEQTHRSGYQLSLQIAQAPGEILTATRRVAVEVDALLAKTVPDIQALPTIINGLADAAGMFTGLATPKVDDSAAVASPDPALQSAVSLQERELRDAIIDLKSKLSPLTGPATKIELIVQSAANKISVAALKDCGVEDDTLAGDISLTPASITPVSNAAAFNRAFIVSGGKPPYLAEILEAPIDKLTISQPVAFGPKVLIRAEAGVAAGGYTVYASDAAGHAKTLTLTVTAAPKAVATPGGTSGGNPPPAPSASTQCPPEVTATVVQVDTPMSEARARCLQKALAMPADKVDGVIGTETREALCGHQESNGVTVEGRFTDAIVNTLVDAFVAAGGDTATNCQ